MDDRKKKKDELISELLKLRKKVARLEKAKGKGAPAPKKGKTEGDTNLGEVLRNFPVMVVAFDDQCNVLYWNKECELATGYTAEEVESNSKAFQLLFPNPDPQTQLLSDWCQAGVDFASKDFYLACKDGSIRLTSWSCVAKQYPIPGWATWWTGRDVTGYRGTMVALHDAEKRYRDLYENAPVGYHMAGPDRKIIDINKTELNLIGYTRDEIVNKKSIHDLISKEDFEKYENQWKLFDSKEADEAIGIEFNMVHKNGNRIPVRLDATIIRDENNELLRTRCVVVDISEPKQMEAELRKAKDLAESATVLKDKFVSLVSHDLRSPFVALLETLKFVVGEAKSAPSEDHTDLLQHSVNTCESALQMIDQLLNISRLQTGNIKPKFQFADARSLCDRDIEKLAYLAEKKGIEIRNEIPERFRIYVDHELFEGVIQNLLSNAVKFCDKGDRITLFCPPGKDTTIAVKDSGMGIKKEILPNLFKFEEKTSTLGTSGERGSGLGLPFSKEIIDLHGGTLTVESKEGKGSTFFVQLPSVRPTILIVDDSKEERGLLKRILKNMDLEILEAENGAEAFDIVSDQNLHLVITDLKMPVLDGFGLLERVRNNKKTEGLPVIITTSGNNPKFRDKAIQLGSDEFFVKPLPREDFLSRVETFLQVG